MNLFGWFGHETDETEETKETEEINNVTTNDNDLIDLLDMSNSFLQQPRRERRRNNDPDSIATSVIQHHQVEALVLKLREAKRKAFTSNYNGSSQELPSFLDLAFGHVSANYSAGSGMMSVTLNGTRTTFLDSYNAITRNHVLEALEDNRISSEDDSHFYDSIMASCSSDFLTDLGPARREAKRDGLYSGMILLQLICARVSMKQRDPHILALEYQTRKLHDFGGNVTDYADQQLKTYSLLSMESYDLTANECHTTPIFRELSRTGNQYFTYWIQTKHNDYKTNCGDYTTRSAYDLPGLLLAASTKYMELKKTQLWSYVAPTNSDELKIPRAYITEFKKWYATKNDVPNTAPSNKPSENPDSSPALPRDRKLWPEPKGNDPTQRVRYGKTHYYCSHHKWNSSHESDKCKFLERKQNKTQKHAYEEIASKSLTIISAGQK